ncbi:MAG: hypothetical protein MJ087_03895 [Lachnospiraceae bacterium]|nr:hypothetical protein [Lachnospiraceae bacterium]
MKYFKRIVAFALAMIMAFSVSVFAEEPASSELLKSKSISIPVVYSYEDFGNITDEIDQESITVKGSNSYFKFKAKKTGFIYLGMKSDAANKKTVKVKKTNSKGKSASTIKKSFKPGHQFFAIVPVTKDKTYRIAMNGAAAGETFYITAVNVVGGGKRYLKEYENGNCSVAAGKKTKKSNYVTYWKVADMPKGALTVFISDVYSSKLASTYITLCNSKKKAISAKTKVTGVKKDGNVYLSQATFGVDQGTYYVKVTTKAPMYGIKMKIDDSYNRRSESKKSKAVTLNEGEARKTVLAASTSKTSHYYKVVLDQKKHVKFDVDGYIAPGTKINLVIYDSKGKATKTLSIKGEVNKIKTIDYGTKDALSAGTYYLAIKKDSKNTSAAYSIYYQTSDESMIKK